MQNKPLNDAVQWWAIKLTVSKSYLYNLPELKYIRL